MTINQIKEQLVSTIESLLKANPLMNHSSYKNKNDEAAFSIFGFEATSVSNLPQTAKDVIKLAKEAGHNCSYSPPSRFNEEGSIYIGPVSKQKVSVSDGIGLL